MKTSQSIIYFFSVLSILSCTPTGPSGATKTNQNTEVLSEVKAKNVILLIGDGMGLPQITGGMYVNNNKTVLEQFPIVGIHKSHSSDNLVTDSAAGATAFASGVKTYNGAIGVNDNKEHVPTILEEAEQRGFKTGLVASSSIVHATPACFFAHADSRKSYEEIASYMVNSGVDFFIGGGKAYFDRREDERNLYKELEDQGYLITDYFKKPLSEVRIPKDKKFGYLTADKEPLSYSQGRDYLIEASKRAIQYLDQRADGKGFFVMIEGSQIDWGGHANDASYVMSELLEYEQVISDALEFAKRDGETLVVVTADHETGGFAINPESTMEELKVSFTTGGHTATMIPVFAYGPGSELFSGIYDNTAIYNKMRSALGWENVQLGTK